MNQLIICKNRIEETYLMVQNENEQNNKWGEVILQDWLKNTHC
jgi:hypothetical protein